MSTFIEFNKIIGISNEYIVPTFQRDYSWSKDEWEDLWNDIEELPSDKTHYLGYLVLQILEGKDDSFSVIDGQQRLSTLSIISLACIKTLLKWADEGIDEDNNKLRASKLKERYVGNFSTTTLTISPKLILNKKNRDFYKNYLSEYKTPVKSKLSKSNKLLQASFEFFEKKIQEKFQHDKNGGTLAGFLENTLGNGLIFTQIIVKSDLDAFKVFETLNARGVKLSTGDLLKNYLFSLTSKLGDLELSDAEVRWENIVNNIKSLDITKFIRHYWNSEYKLERQNTLFKAIKRELNDATSAFKFLKEIEHASIYYSEFSNPSDELWNDDEQQYLYLLKILDVSTCYSLFLAVLRHMTRDNFRDILQEVAIILFRYNISDRNPNDAERLFSKIANEVSKKALTTVQGVIKALESLYTDDDKFQLNFKTVVINTKRKKELAKYILVCIEKELGNVDISIFDNKASIEHILPENPGEIWEDSFDKDVQDDYIYRLGNYTLLEVSKNSKLLNEFTFKQKAEVYKDSRYSLARHVSNFDSFDIKKLNDYQSFLAKKAKTIWKSKYLK